MNTVDHKPHDPMEKERIMNAGGYVSMKRVDGDLAVVSALELGVGRGWCAVYHTGCEMFHEFMLDARTGG